MKRKVFSLMMTLLLAFIGVARADVVTIGEGTSTYYYYPVNMYFHYSLTEQLYTPDEIGTAGTITAIGFYYDYSSAFTMNNVTLYMKNVTRDVFASNMDMEAMTLDDIVWTGTFSATGPGWVTITLDTPFAYDGISNLLVAGFDGTNGYPGSAYKFRTTPCTGYKAITWYSDSYTPDPYTATSFSGSKAYHQYRSNIQLDITEGGSTSGNQIFAVQDGVDVETIVVGSRPNGYWMEPFRFSLRNDGRPITVTDLDFTPNNYFTVLEPEVPFNMARNEEVGVALNTGTTDINTWQMVAIYGTRTARVWDIVADPYDPVTPDVWELACEEATTFPFVEVPATAHNTTLHNDYTLPFPEIPEGVDAVYKLVFTEDQILNAEVTFGDNGKVALYREDFDGEGGPMATNNYTDVTMEGTGGGGGGGTTSSIIDFETGDFSQFNFNNTVSSYPWTVVQEGQDGGYCMKSSNAGVASSISAIEATVNYTSAGLVTFDLWSRGENANDSYDWDKSRFYIDGTCMMDYGLHSTWESFSADVAAGQHTFRWEYKKDGSVNPTGDCFLVDNINFGGGRLVAGNRETFTYGFEGTFDGWTTIDADGDGYNWKQGSVGMAGYVIPSHSGEDCVYSESYSGGVVLHPDNYLVSPQVALGGSISFWACAQDPSYAAEHFGVAVSTTTNNSASAFTTIQEWTMTAKSNGTNTGNYMTRSRESREGTWYNFTVDLSAYSGQGYVAIRHFNCSDMFYLDVDDITIVEGAGGGGGGGDIPEPTPHSDFFSAGPVIENLPVRPGTYYLVASSTTDNFEVTINADTMPCPPVDYAFNPVPADDAAGIEPASVTLHWNIPPYATGWRLIFGTTYHPEVGHPQTIMYPEDGSFTTTLASSYTVRNLWNNNHYFWRVEFNNDGCPDGVSSPVWGFTTSLNTPHNLTVVDATVFDDEEIVLNWSAVVDRTYRQYNVYRDGELIGHTQVNNIDNTTYTDGPLDYNMEGYSYYVTAVYDEGESAPSNTVNVMVSGYGDVNGHVYEQDVEHGIAGATVTMSGADEFGVNHTYNFTTDAQGYYTGHIYAGSYNGTAAKDGYQTAYAPVQGNPVELVYDETTTPVDYVLDENFNPVCSVIAQYHPDSLDPNSPYVKVYWGCGLPGEELVEDFETGDFSQFDWEVDATYPWSITTTNPYEGTYCMKSGGAGVANVVSNMTVTVNIPDDGKMSFFGKISCESNWDYGYFYIDGQQKASFTGAGNWVEKTYDITAGDHTFRWSYTKDSSVNSNDDCFYVDYITFYKRPEPAIPGMTYDFEDGTMQGWTSVDADGDGYGWYMGSEIMTGQTGNNGSNDFVLSQSYYGGIVLYPDNYLVSPQVQLGGVVRFYACAQDASYAAEHFGLAVSTTGTNPSDFTMLQEWTMTAKNAGGSPKTESANPSVETRLMGHSRGGNSREQGNWYEYTVDLSAYSGMGYVAIRHFNCSDMFYLNVDDITIGEPGKGMPSNDRSLAYYRIYRTSCYNDGPYTEDNTVLLASEVTDTVFIDIEWADVAPGVYKWGVGCVYAGNRGELYETPISWGAPVAINNKAGLAAGTFASENGMTATGDHTGNGSATNRDGWLMYDDGVFESSIGLSAGGSFYWGISFPDMTAYDGNQLTKVAYYDNTASTGNIMIFQGGTDAPGTLVYTQPYVTTGIESMVEFTLDTPVQIDGSQSLWVILNNTSGQYVATYAAYCGDDNSQWISTDGSTWYGLYDATGGSYDGTWMIRAYVQDGGGVGPTPGGLNPIQEPRESEIVWSNCLEKDMYLNNLVDINVLLNSADSPEGVTVTFTNLNEYEQELYPIAPLTLDQTGFYSFETFRRGDYIVTIENEGYYPILDTVSIREETHMRYVMTEIIYAVNNLYVSSTGWAMWDGINPVGPTPGPGGGGDGDTFTESWDNGLNGWTNIDADGDGHMWYHSSEAGNHSTSAVTSHSGAGHLMGESYCNGLGALHPDDYLVSPQQYAIASGSTLTFWGCAQDVSYAAEHFGVAISTGSNTNASDFTTIQEWTLTAKGAGDAVVGREGKGTREGTWHQYTCDLSSYAGQNVWIAIRHFNCTDEFIMLLDDAELTSGAKDGDRHLEYYKVMCTSLDGVPIYNENTEYPFCQLATESLVPGDHYICKVAAVYSTGISAWTACEWQYIPCDNYAGSVDGITVEGNTISWTYPGGTGPTPPPGQGDTFTESWDSSLNGWTNIDADGDGHVWYHSTEAGNHSTAAVTSHSGAGHLMGESYCNGLGALHPDDYLVSPQQYAITTGSTLTFWGCAQDVSYAAEHFGVAISTGSNTNASDFTTIQEWTLTAKGAGDAIVGREGKGTREGTWYQYTCDLSSYAGQNVWIAIRHFNCTDEFIMCLDDAELSIAGKGNRAPWDLMGTFFAAEAAQYGVATDGVNIYTCNWGYSSATYNFYKYDMQGNMIEGFNVAGCGTIRDLTYDGQYFYGGANSSVLYCIDLANQTLISSTSTTCSGIRHCSYDPVNDGFWVGGWSDLRLIDRSGATITNGPAVESVSGTGYYEDEDGNPHLYLFTQAASDAKVYDYNILTNTVGAMLKDFSTTPGYNAGSSGGAFIGEYNGKIAFFGDVQQDPNLIGIYELRDGNPGPVPPPASGNLLGAMIFVDGEWTDFVAAPTNTYTYEGEGETICVRMVYNGTNTLPEGNIYYSMSCPECVEITGVPFCAPGAPIHAEVLNATDQVKIWWGEVPPEPMSEWLYYDNGTYATSVGTGSAMTIYWATMFPAATLVPYAGTNMTKAAVFEFTSSTNPVTVTIYLGGTTAPGTPVSSTTFVPSVDGDFEEVAVDPVAIDGTQNLWIVCSQVGEHPAHACTDTGDPNNRWISLDGNAWQDLAAAGLPGYGWLIRGFVTNQGKSGMVENVAIELPAPVAPATSTSVLSHTEVVSIPAPMAFLNRAEMVQFNVYRSADNSTYEMIGSVPYVASQTYYEYIDTPATAGTYYYQVRAEYDNDCESEPAASFDDPTNNYVMVGVTGLGENNGNVALFPNPTKGNVTIQARDMQHITVVGVLGQVVYDADVDTDEVILNMGQFNAGMYTVRIATADGVSVQRITVVK